jgi:hypothetical protein
MADIISVKFRIVTNQKKREIKLELIKAINDDDEIEWTLKFILGEKEKAADKEFVEILSLEVFINPDLNAKAEATRKKGLTTKQSSQAEIAGDFAKALAEGEFDDKKPVEKQTEKIIGVR